MARALLPHEILKTLVEVKLQGFSQPVFHTFQYGVVDAGMRLLHSRINRKAKRSLCCFRIGQGITDGIADKRIFKMGNNSLMSEGIEVAVPAAAVPEKAKLLYHRDWIIFRKGKALKKRCQVIVIKL
jgi:hypothetical protein